MIGIDGLRSPLDGLGNESDSSGTIYAADGNVGTSEREAFADGGSYEFTSFDLTVNNFTEAGSILTAYNQTTIGYYSGNGAGVTDGVLEIEFQSSGMIIEDTINSVGVSYALNYADQNTSNPRWIPDKAYVDSIYTSSYPSFAETNTTQTIQETPEEIDIVNSIVDESSTEYTFDSGNNRFIFDNNANTDKIYKVTYTCTVSTIDTSGNVRGSMTAYSEITTDGGSTVLEVAGSYSNGYLREDSDDDTRFSFGTTFIIKPNQDDASINLWIAKSSTNNAELEHATVLVERIA